MTTPDLSFIAIPHRLRSRCSRVASLVVVAVACQAAGAGAAVRTVYGVAATPSRVVVAQPTVVVAPKAVVVAPAPKVVVVAPAPAVVALPAGYIAVLPGGYKPVVVRGVHYFYVGGIYYQPQFYQGRTVYIRVRL